MQRLRELGWIENRTVAAQYRLADRRNEPLQTTDVVGKRLELSCEVVVSSPIGVLEVREGQATGRDTLSGGSMRGRQAGVDALSRVM